MSVLRVRIKVLLATLRLSGLFGRLKRSYKRPAVSKSEWLDTMRRRAEEFAAETRPRFEALAPSGGSVREVLLVGLSDPGRVAMEIPMLAALIVAGYRPVVAVRSRDEEHIVRRIYGSFGVKKFLVLEDYLRRDGLSFFTRTFPEIRTQEDALRSIHGGIAVGRYALARTMRRSRLGEIDLNDPVQRAMAEPIFARTYVEGPAAARLVEDVGPALFFNNFNRGYPPYGMFCDASVNSGVPVITVRQAHRPSSFAAKRLGLHNIDVSPMRPSAETCARLNEMQWDERYWDELRSELSDSYSSGNWFNLKHKQSEAVMVEREALRAQLDFEDDKPIVGIFPHVFWDGSFFYGEDLMGNYERWFRAVAAVAARNRDCNWLIKIHPSNQVFQKRYGLEAASSSEDAILAEFAPLPPNVRVLTPGTKVTALSVIELIDICLTVRGTVGLEAASFGKRVVTGGTGGYDGLGFTLDPVDREDFTSLLEQLPDVPVMTAEEIELARKHAYTQFIARTLQVRALSWWLTGPEKRTVDFRFQVASAEDLARSVDISYLSAWIAGGAEDFLNPGSPVLESDLSSV